MTMDVTDLRQVLAEDAENATFPPLDPDTVIVTARRRRNRRMAAAGVLVVGLVGGATAVVWSNANSAAGGTATLVPASQPASSPASPRVVGITRPLVVDGGPLRLDPAGTPPASTASGWRLLAADRGTAFGGPNARTQLLYGAFTHNTADLVPDLSTRQRIPTSYNHRLAVWIVDHVSISESGKAVPVTFYTAVDPVTAKVLFAWNVEGSPPPQPLPVPFPHVNPGPSTLAPQTGIVDQAGQFHATWWQGTNAWVREVAPNSYLDVYAGGQPVDPTLEQTDATLAGVLVVTPKDQLTGPIMSNGTRYLAPSAPTGKLQILSVQGSVLTLQLVGTSQTYEFDTQTDTFR
jgi:hypothetical protein